MGYYADLIKQKQNAKEEKENESTVEKFDHYGSKIEIIKTDSGNFRYRVSKKGKFKESMSVSTRSEAMRDAIKDAETWANEKEEKDNDDSAYVRAIKKAERIIDRLLQTREETDARNFLRKMGWSMSTLGDRFDIARSIRRAVRTEPDKADSVLNNEKEEKDNASVQDRFRYKGCMITILKKGENQYTFTVEQDGREEGTKAIYPTQDKAESEAKREVEANWNEKEEGYYAKLAEEKASRKN